MTLLALFLTSTTFSQTLPPWTSDGTNACYTLEGARALKHFELTCQECCKNSQLRAEQYSLCKKAADNASSAYLKCVDSSRELLALIEASDKLLTNTDRLLQESEAWSLKGPALPWAIAGGLLLFIGGAVFGATL